MIHSALTIRLNENITKFNALNEERWDIFIKTYDQFYLFVIDEIFLFGNIMLYFIDHILHIIKQINL
jgi:hypothetical protein